MTARLNELADQFIEKVVGELIRETRATKGELRDLHVEEISAVDRPANKRKFLVVKRDETTKADVPPIGRAVVWHAIELQGEVIRKREPELTKEQAEVKAMEEMPELLELYEKLARNEEPEFAPAPVEQAEPATPAWDRIEALAKVKLEKGSAPTRAEALAAVFEERPDLYEQASAER